MKRRRVTKTQAGQRFDIVASGWLNITRSQAGRAIRTGELLLNGISAKAGELLRTGDKLSYQVTAPSSASITVPIVYEDDDILVVDKPAGLIVHPTSRGKHQPSLVDFARSRSQDPHELRPGIVHRLDKDTSGLLIVAKTLEAKEYLQRQFASHKVEKEYVALVSGILPKRSAEIKLPIGSGIGVKRQVDPKGRLATTRYEVMKQYGQASLVHAWPQSGRTHQLRVHFAAIGHPIIGDGLYGKADTLLHRQFLHAHKLGFNSPSGRWLELTSPMPKELKVYLDRLG